MMTSSDTQVLIVEDTQSDADLARETLQQENFAKNVHVARDGEEALDFIFCRGAFSGRSPNDLPSLILLDMKLPKVDGTEVLRQIKSDERTRIIPVVILTSSGEQSDLAATYDLGANSYIRKPAEPGQFRGTVKRVGAYWLVTNQRPVAAAAQAKVKSAP
jgi:two-component system, response regulator